MTKVQALQNTKINDAKGFVLNDFANLKELCELYPFFKINTLRYYLSINFNEVRTKCAMKIGGKVFINKNKYVDWCNSLVKRDYDDGFI